MKYTTDLNELQPISNEYTKRWIDVRVALAATVREVWPDVTLIHEYYTSDNGLRYFEHSYIALSLAPLITIDQDDEGRYRVFCRGVYNFDMIDDYTLRDIRSSIEAPKKFKVLTAKNIQKWVDYETKVYEAVKAEHEKRVQKITDFLDTLKGEQVVWYSENRSGYIERGGLRYKFNIDSTGYIKENIELTSFNHNLDLFKKLTSCVKQ